VMFSLIFLTGSSLSDQVHQNPADMYKNPGQTAEITCSHRIDTYNQILWYKQTKTGQLQLLGYMFITNPSLEPGVTNKYSASKAAIENGALTVNDLQQNDSGVYFCAVSKHSDVRSRRSCTKTARQPT
uniref:Ig-like domain-containing protein n=1 Tax=Oreochromis niloticus TaxID=8128 RepID=A0A669F1T0_ORENI